MTDEDFSHNNESTLEASDIYGKGHILSDMQLELHVEIGRAKIKISELINLVEGSIVQLEQDLQEPLTIYVNDKPIAKGQIISSNGKYNIRVL